MTGSWKEATVADVTASHAQEAARGGKSTGAERALQRRRLDEELAHVNAFLASHKNTRTGKFDDPVTLEEWCSMLPEKRRQFLEFIGGVR
jgi:hypothetical protein